MNILHVNQVHFFRGGAESVYLRTAKLLETHGHKSVFFSMHHPDNLPCVTKEFFMPYVDLNAKYGIIKQFKIAGRILYSFEARKRLSKLLDKYPVDVAHIHNIYHNISPSILHELKKRKIPVVQTLHDFKIVCASHILRVKEKPCEACKDGKYFMAIKKRCVKDSLTKSILCALEMYLHHKILNIFDNIDIFISPSIFFKDKLLEMGFKREVIHLPNFIDIKKIDEIKGGVKYNNQRGVKILYFGRLSPEKGLWTLIKAAQLLLHKNKKLEIYIIGTGPIMEALHEEVRRGQINNVRFLGYMDQKKLYQELEKSIATVLPSECYENNPVSVLESFASGKPVIGAKIGGIPELVRDNNTGLIFQAGNAGDLASKIEYLIDNPDKSREMGINARRLVERELNPEKYYNKLMEIYRRAIQK
jgi:glycosyltransferase involved in cell wall biosynthesis